MMPSEGPEDDSHKVIIELDYGHFVTLHGWLYLAQVVFGLLSIACSAPGTFPSQIYFLIIVVTGFIGSILLCLIRLRFPRFNKKGKQAEFIYTAIMVFFYFTAFTAQFADLYDFDSSEYVHRYDAQIVAGVFAVCIWLTYFVIIYFMFNDALMWYEEFKGETKPENENSNQAWSKSNSNPNNISSYVP